MVESQMDGRKDSGSGGDDKDNKGGDNINKLIK